jgi:hypothetical protein
VKIAFCVEDDTDRQIFVRIVNRVLGREIEVHRGEFALREGGFDKALKLAYPVAANAFDARCDAVVFAIDNDDGDPPHALDHEPARDSTCRWCRLAFAANAPELKRRASRAGRTFGLVFAVPIRTLETWLLLAEGSAFPSAPESEGVGAAGRRRLKQLLYGDAHADAGIRTARAFAIVDTLDMRTLAARSPSFNHFVRQLESLPTN